MAPFSDRRDPAALRVRPRGPVPRPHITPPHPRYRKVSTGGRGPEIETLGRRARVGQLRRRGSAGNRKLESPTG